MSDDRLLPNLMNAWEEECPAIRELKMREIIAVEISKEICRLIEIEEAEWEDLVIYGNPDVDPPIGYVRP